jgi:hypothetical protein
MRIPKLHITGAINLTDSFKSHLIRKAANGTLSLESTTCTPIKSSVTDKDIFTQRSRSPSSLKFLASFVPKSGMVLMDKPSTLRTTERAQMFRTISL